MKKYLEYIPGFAAALLIAAVARWLESLLPIHLIGASVIALFIGMGINHFVKPGKLMSPGIKFTSKKILKFAIILLGASLSIGTIMHMIPTTIPQRVSFSTEGTFSAPLWAISHDNLYRRYTSTPTGMYSRTAA